MITSRRTIGAPGLWDWERTTIEARICRPSLAAAHCVELKIEETGEEKRTSLRIVYLTKTEAVELGEHLIQIGSQDRCAAGPGVEERAEC